MVQLKLFDILCFVKELKKSGMTDKEINSLPIYLGDDDELNGIHCAWYTNLVDTDDKDEDNMYVIEMINDNWGNHKLETGKAILIS